MKTLLEAMDNLKSKKDKFSTKQEVADFFSTLDDLGIHPEMQKRAEIIVPRDSDIFNKIVEYQNKYRVHYINDIKTPYEEDYIQATVYASTKRIPTKETLLKIVTDKKIVDKEVLWDLVYYFDGIGFYQEDKRRSKRQYIYDCIDNCYTGNIGIYHTYITDINTAGTNRETSDEDTGDILKVFEKLSLV